MMMRGARSLVALSTGPASRRFLKTVAPSAAQAEPLADFAQGEAIPEAKPLYLDLQATTPTDPRVLDTMMPFSVGSFGNPHSRTHAYGWEAEDAVEVARKQVADLIGADAREII